MVSDAGLKLPELETETVYVCGVAGGVYTHDCVVTGVPPVQPVGEEEFTVRVWVLSA
jgi:hypothetical protein